MYISYLFDWLYKVMQIRVPLVLSNDIYALVSGFDIFMFTLFIGIFIVLIRYIITNNLSLRVGKMSDFSYSPHFRKSMSNSDSLVSEDSYKDTKIYSNNSIGGRILNRKTLKNMKGE